MVCGGFSTELPGSKAGWGGSGAIDHGSGRQRKQQEKRRRGMREDTLVLYIVCGSHTHRRVTPKSGHWTMNQS